MKLLDHHYGPDGVACFTRYVHATGEDFSAMIYTWHDHHELRLPHLYFVTVYEFQPRPGRKPSVRMVGDYNALMDDFGNLKYFPREARR